jgi:hypothetical protein
MKNIKNQTKVSDSPKSDGDCKEAVNNQSVIENISIKTLNEIGQQLCHMSKFKRDEHIQNLLRNNEFEWDDEKVLPSEIKEFTENESKRLKEKSDYLDDNLIYLNSLLMSDDMYGVIGSSIEGWIRHNVIPLVEQLIEEGNSSEQICHNIGEICKSTDIANYFIEQRRRLIDRIDRCPSIDLEDECLLVA